MKILSSTPKCLKWLCSLIEKILCLTNIYPSNIPSIFVVNPNKPLFVVQNISETSLLPELHKNEDGSDDAQLEHMLYRIVKSSCNDQQATFGALRQTYDAHETEDTNRGCQLYLAVSGGRQFHTRPVIHKQAGSPAPCRWRRRSPHLTS